MAVLGRRGRTTLFSNFIHGGWRESFSFWMLSFGAVPTDFTSWLKESTDVVNFRDDISVGSASQVLIRPMNFFSFFLS